MKIKLVILSLTIVALLGVYAVQGQANEGTNQGEKPMAMKMDDMGKGMAASDMAEEIKEAVEIGNKICPVSGEKIAEEGEKGEMGESVKYEYKGKIYNLCCPMCIKDFKKNPEKYSKIAQDEVNKNKEMESEAAE